MITKRYAGSRRRGDCRKVDNTGRTLRFTAATESRLAMLTIKTKRDIASYVLNEIGSNIGRGFILAKLDQEGTYETHIGGQGLCSCTCDGFSHGFSCRHVDALAKVIELGLIPVGTP